MLTALFTSSDRQLDTKERRRYELKLSKAPNMRTAIIALLAIFVISSGLTALGAEIKVTDVPSLRACVSGQAIPAGSTSPDVGRTAGPGDTCVVFDGVYNVGPGSALFVSVENSDRALDERRHGHDHPRGTRNRRPDQHLRARRDLWGPGT
jgi:hypothetical protein